jgi:hypothetical protein
MLIVVQSNGVQPQVPASVQMAFGMPMQPPQSSVPPQPSSQTPQSTLSFLQVVGLQLSDISSPPNDAAPTRAPSMPGGQLPQ